LTENFVDLVIQKPPCILKKLMLEAPYLNKFVYFFRCLTDRLKVVSLEQAVQADFGWAVYSIRQAKMHNRKPPRRE
jgi:hypothetical protein